MADACAIHKQLLAAIRAKTPGIPVARVNPKFMDPIPNLEVQKVLDLMKATINPKDGVLPDEVVAWVELMLRDPDGEQGLTDSGISIRTEEFTRVVDYMGTGVADGLLYLSSTWCEEGFLRVYVLDVRGGLAELVDGGAAGA